MPDGTQFFNYLIYGTALLKRGSYVLSVAAAAAENENDGKDDYPSAVIVEDVT